MRERATVPLKVAGFFNATKINNISFACLPRI